MLLVAVGHHQLPQSRLLLDLEAKEREEYYDVDDVVESSLPDYVSSLVLDLERQIVLSSVSTIPRLGLRLRQDAEVILVVLSFHLLLAWLGLVRRYDVSH